MRVVSLVPSATEALCLLGGEQLLVGRSHECDFPTTITDRPILTSQTTDFAAAGGSGASIAIDRQVSDAAHAGQSLYRLNAELLRSLQPDLILTQDLCGVCSIDLGSVREVVKTLRPEPRILSLNPHTFEDVLDDLLRIGRAIDRPAAAEHAVIGLQSRFFTAAEFVNAFTRPVPTLFVEWLEPIFVGGHWVPQLIERAGGAALLNPTGPLPGAGAGAGRQMAHRVAGPSRRISHADAESAAPEAIVVCPCGLSLGQAEAELAQVSQRPWFARSVAAASGRVAMVDGTQMFSRPGPRLVDAYEWLVGWLNDIPDLISPDFPWSPWRGSA